MVRNPSANAGYPVPWAFKESNSTEHARIYVLCVCVCALCEGHSHNQSFNKAKFLSEGGDPSSKTELGVLFQAYVIIGRVNLLAV